MGCTFNEMKKFYFLAFVGTTKDSDYYPVPVLSVQPFHPFPHAKFNKPDLSDTCHTSVSY